MNILDHNEPDFAAAIARLCCRSDSRPAVDHGVAQILADIRANGDAAIIRYAKEFDHVDLSANEFRVPLSECEIAVASLNEATRRAIRFAYENVYEFSHRRRPESWTSSPRPGVTVGERFSPIRRVVAYIPGGSAPLASTVVHTVTMAKAAGVEEIVVTTPCAPSRELHPAVLYAAVTCGATEVYRLGGVYAIGAFAFGTESIVKADKIVGPGNSYVTAAKRHVYGHVGLDLVAGPSEIMVIADASADPEHIAADLLAQAEHGSGDEVAVLVSASRVRIEQTLKELDAQRKRLHWSERIAKVMREGLHVIHVRDLDQAIAIANDFAPEHLEIIVARPEEVLPQIRSAGAVFIGPWSPEAVGDYVAGPSHVLPTGGAGRYLSGLAVDQFFRRSSLIQYTEAALRREAQAITQLATVEQLDAHANAVNVRLKS